MKIYCLPFLLKLPKNKKYKMKKITVLILIVITGYFIFTGQKNSEGSKNSGKQKVEAPRIWNIHKLMKWYTDRGLTLPDYIPNEINNMNRSRNFMTDIDQPDVRVFPSNNAQSENSIAISQVNPQNLFISVNMPFTQSWFFSTNGGSNWFGSESDPNNYSNFGDPVALFDLSGNAYWATLTSPGGIGVTKTTNFGVTWGPLWYADPPNHTSDDKEHVMTDLSGVYPNNLYMALTDFGFGNPPIIYSRSTNGGANWSARVSLTTGVPFGQGVNIQTGPNGEVYIAWASYPATLPENGIGFAKSTDGGETFTTPSVIFPINGIRTSNGGIPEYGNTRVNSFPSMAVDRSTGVRRGWIYIVYPDKSTGDADVYVNRSTDGGATWSDKIRVNSEPSGDGKPQWMSSASVDPTNGVLSISYYSMDSTGFLTSRILATSFDGATTWDRQRVSDARFVMGPIPGFAAGYAGDYYETASHSGKVIPCWSDNRPGPWQAFVSVVSLGPSISHVPLPNTENLNGPYIVNALISTAGSGLVTGKTKVFWGRNTISDSIVMTNSSGNNWTASIPGNGAQAQYRYYISTIDSMGRTASAPNNAPPAYYSFIASSDTARPVITFTPLGNQPITLWPSTVSASVTDNIGLDSVWVRWYKNTPANLKHFRLPNTGGNNYSAPFNSTASDVSIGDSIFYKIFAVDNSALHNADSTALVKFKIINTYLCQDFSSTEFPPQNWSVEYSGTLYWVRSDASGYGAGTGSAEFNFYDAMPGTTQSLITLTFAPTITGDSIKFDHAYCTYQDEVDQLEITTSSNGGGSYSPLVLLDGGTSGPLVTAPPDLDPFIPSSSQWATKKYPLPAGTNKIQFKAISQYGNNLYLDNICVVGPSVGISNLVNNLIPEHYSLSQNYPNPFNPSTIINYSISKSNLVTLKIYDILGKEVALLINEKQNAGNYSVQFNGANLSSGIYFYSIQSGEFNDVKRMVLVK